MRRFLAGLIVVVISLVFMSGELWAVKRYKKAVSATPAAEAAEAAGPVLEPAIPGEAAEDAAPPKFPEKGWHKGPYATANIGLIQSTNDRHIVTDQAFGSSAEMMYGLTFGWDITDWIGPLLQLNFGTKTGSVGDANNTAAITTYPTNPGIFFPIGTFPVENAREWTADASVFVRATLPYFVRAKWQPGIVKIIPFLKVGATGHAVYVNASTAADKIGAFGGGPAVGALVEFYIWKGFFVGLDVTEHLIFQKALTYDITTTVGSMNFKVTEGGFKPQFTFAGLLGWHF